MIARRLALTSLASTNTYPDVELTVCSTPFPTYLKLLKPFKLSFIIVNFANHTYIVFSKVITNIWRDSDVIEINLPYPF